MKIAIVRERAEGETRVAATPETVGRFMALGNSVSIEQGAGEQARFPDADYKAAGAEIAATAAAALKDADIVLTVRRCPAWHHVEKIAGRVSPNFCDQTTITYAAMAEGTPFSIDTEITGPGSCRQVIRRRA